MGQFKGHVETRWLRDTGEDRLMLLLKDFIFIDDHGIEWVAPVGSIIDGASIPKFLWSIVGGPLEGDYRRASVLHDVYCKSQDKPHKEVHDMFYHAMIADAVPKHKAKYMHFAVRTFGPKWTVPIE